MIRTRHTHAHSHAALLELGCTVSFLFLLSPHWWCVRWIALHQYSVALQCKRCDETRTSVNTPLEDGSWMPEIGFWIIQAFFYRQIEIFLERNYACTYSTAACDWCLVRVLRAQCTKTNPAVQRLFREQWVIILGGILYLYLCFFIYERRWMRIKLATCHGGLRFEPGDYYVCWIIGVAR